MITILRAEAPTVARAVAGEVEEQVPIYRQWRELGHGDELADAIHYVIVEFLDLVESGEQHPDSQVFEIARLRARQGLPAHAILSAWRVSNHGLWRWLTTRFPEEFAPGGSGIDLWSRYLDFADHYVDQISDAFLEATQDERVHEALASRARVDDLVRGLPPEETQQSLRELGVLSRQVLVVMCRAPDAGPDTSAELVSDYGLFLKTLRIRTKMAVPWSMKAGSLIALVPAIDARFDFVEEAVPPGTTLRLGVSKLVAAHSDLSSARQQAERALAATSARRPVNDLNRMSLLDVAAMQAPLRWIDLPPWLQTMLTDERHSADWEALGHALFEHGSSVSAAAKAMNVHTNTVYYRLDAIRSACGVDLRATQVLAELEIACSNRDFGLLSLPEAGEPSH